MKSPEKSRFGKLVTYLLDPQNKKTRVGEVARAKSPRTYHLIISLRDGANPDAQTLRMIEERFLQCARLR